MATWFRLGTGTVFTAAFGGAPETSPVLVREKVTAPHRAPFARPAPPPFQNRLAKPFRERTVVAITPLLLMEFLSVRAAAERVGKSTSSIRRLLYPIIKQDDHPDRDLVRPSVADAMRLRMSGENFPWQVSEELLKRVTVAGNNTDHSPAPSTGKLGGNGESELLPMLRSELDIKNKQISGISELLGKQVERVSGLSDRLREGNVLIAALQQRLALTDGREAKPTSFADAQSTPEPPEESVAPDAKSTGTASPKKGFFGRFFGRAS